MSNLRNIARGLAVRRYGSLCHCCGVGPLSGKALFLAPIGFPEVGGLDKSPDAPVCSSCSTALKTTPVFRHIANLRKNARWVLVTTRRWSNDYALNTPLFVEQDRYDLVPRTK